jgi:hypothetical protein
MQYSLAPKYSIPHILLIPFHVELIIIIFTLKALVSKPKEARKLARWILGLRILPKFHLAEELLRGEWQREAAQAKGSRRRRGFF